MSISLTIDGQDHGQIATNRGWTEFTDWILSQPTERATGYRAGDLARYSELRHLAFHGWTDQVATVCIELKRVLKAVKNESQYETEPDITEHISIGDELLERLKLLQDDGGIHNETVCTIGDGTGAGDDEG